jgi:hypothetical protein
MTSTMTILITEAIPAEHNQLMLRGLKKSVRGLCTSTIYNLTESKEWCTNGIFVASALRESCAPGGL